ncbi:hypothetical protein [Streptomyces spiramyceticus]|uniref:hypothetical protein n=1 Tax=Streptomyces spiramyceticus TaxID=299717 RepID=UPI00237A15A0|nr:hypothetical protein [Streptomyces spiramyceticus]
MLITDAAVQETGHTVANTLACGWAIDPDAPADGAAHLLHPDGRRIGLRPIFGGTTVQLWITGNAAPPPADDADKAAHETYLAGRLAEGRHYHAAISLVEDADEANDDEANGREPADLITEALDDKLLPAFEQKPFYVGHRPWITAFDEAMADITAERNATPAELRTEAHEDDPADDQDSEANAPVSDEDGDHQSDRSDDKATDTPATPAQEAQQSAPEPK